MDKRGLEAVETREITVLRTSAHFDDFWMTTRRRQDLNSITAGISSGDVERLKAWMKERSPADSDGRRTC